MVANLIKTLLVLFVFLILMKNSESQSVPDVEVGSPSIRDIREVEDRGTCRDTKAGGFCWSNSECCSRQCYFFHCSKGGLG